ncbi:hypothetical protein CONLIGDRAFT_141979 [Coniochaeta ligniaria NRRL 30616]|uniref:Uncharacterized protein n=1 Tax=Coniochaeta ligniaria NRRL 30616 TaxID=1408157 RepID=A0A1J7J281_9PEZI|nr:hypothetical protein CONLIGDRAFT_141979 [Coniochaeta ligniaria NRRL 30616]
MIHLPTSSRTTSYRSRLRVWAAAVHDRLMWYWLLVAVSEEKVHMSITGDMRCRPACGWPSGRMLLVAYNRRVTATETLPRSAYTLPRLVLLDCLTQSPILDALLALTVNTMARLGSVVNLLRGADSADGLLATCLRVFVSLHSLGLLSSPSYPDTLSSCPSTRMVGTRYRGRQALSNRHRPLVSVDMSRGTT